MNNDKPRYKLIDIESNEWIYCDAITGTELSWIYLHYVTQDNTVSLRTYIAELGVYARSLEEDYRFGLLLQNIYHFGITF